MYNIQYLIYYILNISTNNILILRLTVVCSDVLYLGLCHCLHECTHRTAKAKAPDKAACISPFISVEIT